MNSLVKWPQKPLAQLVGAKATPVVQNETKALPIIQYPASLFWRADGSRIDDSPAVPQVSRANAYAVASLAYGCMSYRAGKLAEPPVWIKEEVEGSEEWLDSKADHPLARLLEEPNPDMDMHELMELMSLYLDGTGRALLLKSRDNVGRTAALYPFSGDEFTVEPADGRLYDRFRVRLSRGQDTFGPDDVIFFKEADPRNPLEGLGPLDVALSSINIDENMRQAVKAMLRNKIMPGGVAFFPNGCVWGQRASASFAVDSAVLWERAASRERCGASAGWVH